jgi:hypothetical protein
MSSKQNVQFWIKPNGQDVGCDGEDLIRATALLIAHPPDHVQANDGLLVSQAQTLFSWRCKN